MDNLPKTIAPTRLTPGFREMVKQVQTVTIGLVDIAQKEGLDVGIVTKIWAALPLEESEGITYLEVAGQCILEVSTTIDQAFPDLPYNEKIAKKYELMAALLQLKAEQVKQSW